MEEASFGSWQREEGRGGISFPKGFGERMVENNGFNVWIGRKAFLASRKKYITEIAPPLIELLPMHDQMRSVCPLVCPRCSANVTISIKVEKPYPEVVKGVVKGRTEWRRQDNDLFNIR